MIENIMGIMFLLVGAMAVCIVWLFIDVHKHEDTIRYLETEQRNNERQDHELWKSVDRCEERIAKMDCLIHEELIHDGPEVSGDGTGDMWYIVPWGEWAVDIDFKVTHWQPMPEPPEEVKE